MEFTSEQKRKEYVTDKLRGSVPRLTPGKLDQIIEKLEEAWRGEVMDGWTEFIETFRDPDKKEYFENFFVESAHNDAEAGGAGEYDLDTWEIERFRQALQPSTGGKRSRRKRTKKSRTIGGKKSRKQRKRTTLKGGKRKRRRTRRRR